MPAAVQRSTICPSRQRVTLRLVARAMEIIDSIVLNAERSFRRIKGYKQMPQLIDALHRHAHPDTDHATETVGAAA
jgi:hypothetical protein